jgi:succinate dehydrogenase / fumarate reductase membrane anchor subunit
MSGASVHHWRNQRLSALALIPLTLWFVAAMLGHLGEDRAQFTAWLSQPVPLVLTAVLVLAVLYHMALGLVVVIEDYVTGPKCQSLAISVVRKSALALAVIALVALAKIGFGS